MHYHGRKHGSVQVDVVLEELRALYLDLQRADGDFALHRV